jgi:hypothetical protein
MESDGSRLFRRMVDGELMERDSTMSGSYDTAQICLNGHVVTTGFHDYPQFRARFCKECGAGTIMQCDSCKTEIKGSLRSPRVIAI